jgi:hypothetical protein
VDLLAQNTGFVPRHGAFAHGKCSTFEGFALCEHEQEDKQWQKF